MDIFTNISIFVFSTKTCIMAYSPPVIFAIEMEFFINA